MRNIIIMFMLLFIGNITFAQKITSSDTTQKKIQKGSVNNKNANKKEQDTQEIHITQGSSGVKRSIGYKFSTLREDDDPGDGIFRYNNGTVAKITYIFVDNKDISGEDQTKWYSTWDDTTGATGRGQLILADNEGRNVNIFNVSDRFAVFAGIAYEMQKLEFSNTDPYTNNYKKNASSLSLNIGISF